MVWSHWVLVTLAGALVSSAVPEVAAESHRCQDVERNTHFLAIAGGGSPASNEIALEKNVLYFQRVLNHLGYNPENDASFFFANGNDGKRTVRYLDRRDRERFKVPKIPFLEGSATVENMVNWFRMPDSQVSEKELFLYFTGHGIQNPDNTENNSLLLWNNNLLNVREFSRMLDILPADKPVVMMMAQCFSGSFANTIYRGGNPENPVASQTRCGFFATVETLPSVGCTPEVNEADYIDYSSSFFSGLSGQKRTGEKAPSADYNKDGKVTYNEAHAFAKIDNASIDLPLSTSENWLRQQLSEPEIQTILQQPITNLMQTARPEQSYVINQLMERFEWNHLKSYTENLETLDAEIVEDEVEETFAVRLMLELVNVAAEAGIREQGDEEQIAILDRLLSCESGSWVN